MVNLLWINVDIIATDTFLSIQRGMKDAKIALFRVQMFNSEFLKIKKTPNKNIDFHDGNPRRFSQGIR